MTEKSGRRNKLKKKVKKFFRENPAQKDDLELRVGQVMWDRMMYFDFDDSQLAVLPIARKKSKKTKGILFVFLDDKKNILNMAYERRNHLDHLSEKTEEINGVREVDLHLVLTFFLIFDKDVFDYYDCKLIEQLKSLDNKNSRMNKSCYMVYEIVGATLSYQCTGPVNDPTYFCSNYSALFRYDWVPYCPDGSGNPINTQGNTQGTSGNNNGTNSGTASWSFQHTANLCLNNFTYIGEGKYVYFTNLDQNFIHQQTGIGAKANISRICFQFSANFSDNYTKGNLILP